MHDPLISVIIPTYNREHSTRGAIESVLAQSYKNLELLVVDDGSTDGTADMLKNIEDERFSLISIPNSGVSRARNLGVEKAVGELITFLDSDDEWHQGKLSTQLDFHLDHPELKISQTQEIWIRNGRRVNPKNKHRKPQGNIFPQSLELCTITPSSVMMTRELFASYSGFDEKMLACEDYDLWLRITAEHQVGLVDQYLMTRYGGHEDQLSRSFIAMDRFRIYSLGKILLSNTLDEIQAGQVVEVLKRKLEILLAGAKKRNRVPVALRAFLESLPEAELNLMDFRKMAEISLLTPAYT
jgi:glycosyltransferase involved in cell wall biosynthesis